MILIALMLAQPGPPPPPPNRDPAEMMIGDTHRAPPAVARPRNDSWLADTGENSCASWIGSKAADAWGRYVHLSWLSAFLGSLDGDILRFDSEGEGTNFEIITQLMDDHCAAHPDDSLAKGAQGVAVEMIRRNQGPR